MALFSASGYLEDKLNLDKFKKLYYKEDGKTKSLNIGAFQSQKFNLSNTITDNPVEFGANLADSIYKNPDRVQVAIIVGDAGGLIETAINTVKDFSTRGFLEEDILGILERKAIDFIDGNATGNYKSSKVFNEIIRIKENFLPCELVTRDRIYKNLQVESIDREITVENYNGAIIIVSLKNLMVFGTQTQNSLFSTIKRNGFMNLKTIGLSVLGRFL